MDHTSSTQPEQMPRQPWEEPAIVLERPLEVKAQVKLPGSDSLNPLGGFLGPLSTSSGTVCT